MRILYITHEVPFPPDNGIRIVPFHSMKLMQARGHEIAVCTLSGEQVRESVESIQSRFEALKHRLHLSHGACLLMPARSTLASMIDLCLGRLSYVQRFRSTVFAQLLDRMIADFKPEVVHIDSITLLQYEGLFRQSACRVVASINDSHTLTLMNQLKSGRDRGLRALARRWQLLLTRRYEQRIYRKVSAVHVMTDVDRQFLEELTGLRHLHVIPNGVPDELFGVSADFDRKSVIFVGSLHGNNLHAAQRFIEEGWPLVHARHPDATLTLIGRCAPAIRDELSKYAGQGVLLRGYVERLEEVYAGASLAISPIDKNSGVLNKLIEAMAAGVPVAGLRRSFAGISGAEEGVHFVGADSNPELGEAIAVFLDDTTRRKMNSLRARQLAQDMYSWTDRAGAYEAMYATGGVSTKRC